MAGIDYRSMDKAKDTYIAVMNCGEHDLKRPSDHLLQFGRDMRRIAQELSKIFPDTFREITNRPRDEPVRSVLGSFLSTICCRVENFILNKMITVIRDWFPGKSLMRAIENKIRESIGLDIELAAKPLNKSITFLFNDQMSQENISHYDDGKEGIGIELKCGTKE
eukprot:450836_1